VRPNREGPREGLDDADIAIARPRDADLDEIDIEST
jgi:hypothetical protein